MYVRLILNYLCSSADNAAPNSQYHTARREQCHIKQHTVTGTLQSTTYIRVYACLYMPITSYQTWVHMSNSTNFHLLHKFISKLAALFCAYNQYVDLKFYNSVSYKRIDKIFQIRTNVIGTSNWVFLSTSDGT